MSCLDLRPHEGHCSGSENNTSLRRVAFVTLAGSTGLVLVLALGVAAWLVHVAATRSASVVFVNGRIHTMNGNGTVVEAMQVQRGRIVALGTTTEIDRRAPADVTRVDLRDRAVLPGFIDAHSHFPVSGLADVSVDLSAPPLGVIASRRDLLARLARAVRERPTSGWLLGFNYDNTAFVDGRHPTRAELDSVVTDRPMYLWHSSGHMGVANSAALAALGLDEHSVTTAGGVIGRDSDGRLDGLLQERAAPSLARLLRSLSWTRLPGILRHAREEYLAAGVTTVQNGHANLVLAHALRWAQRVGWLPQRLVLWPLHGMSSEDLLAERFPAPSADAVFSVRGVKLIVDGSPQGLTAWLSEPYAATAGLPVGYAGHAAMPVKTLHAEILRYHLAGRHLALHGNGDAAIEAIITGVAAAHRVAPRDDARHVLVHAQTLRLDQVRRLVDLPLTPSFFVAHTWYWGDWHRLRGLGPSRADTLSPTGWADELGVRYTLHTDAPVTPMDPMQVLWSATERQTVSGVVLGPRQRVSRQAALRALTIDAAWQNGLEASLGSLERGKLADLIVLSDDPFTVPDVRDLVVESTWISGVRRFHRP